MLFIAERRRHQ